MFLCFPELKASVPAIKHDKTTLLFDIHVYHKCEQKIYNQWLPMAKKSFVEFLMLGKMATINSIIVTFWDKSRKN